MYICISQEPTNSWILCKLDTQSGERPLDCKMALGSAWLDGGIVSLTDSMVMVK